MTTDPPRARPLRPPSPQTPAIPRGPAALLGIAAVALAIGAGHLVAALVAPAASPPLAVGAAAVRLAPLPVVEFATATFGTADKIVLLSGVTVVLVAVAALAGLAARRRPDPATIVVIVLGLVAGAAVWTAPSFSQLDLLPPMAATLAGVWAVRWLHGKALRAVPGDAVQTDAVQTDAVQTDAVQTDVVQTDVVQTDVVQTGVVQTGDAPGDAAPGDDTVALAPELDGGASLASPVRRRTVLGSAGALGVVGAAALVTGGAGQLLNRGVGGSRDEVTRRLAAARVAPAPPIPPGADLAAFGAPPVVTPNADFYRIDTALRVPALEAADWTLRVHGMVGRELSLSFADLLARPLVTRTLTMACVSNEVGGSLVSTAQFIGVDLRDLLLEAGVGSGADQLLSTSTDGWTAGTPTAVVLEPDRGALLAVGMNGEALPREHGFPVRMVVPGLYGFVSGTKWLVDLELTTFDARRAYWLQRGWAQRAPIKTQSRIDLPQGSAEVRAGTVPLVGTAWAPHVGVDGVEVRVDEGPWRAAQLGTEVDRDTWRMWRAELDLTPGRHVLQCRATDRTGATQTGQLADPVPDGATGWHTVAVTAS